MNKTIELEMFPRLCRKRADTAYDLILMLLTELKRETKGSSFITDLEKGVLILVKLMMRLEMTIIYKT